MKIEENKKKANLAVYPMTIFKNFLIDTHYKTIFKSVRNASTSYKVFDRPNLPIQAIRWLFVEPQTRM